jgi:hypothetical protein
LAEVHFRKIFELIRKEEAILWIGSGFSLYAGYPSGSKLSEIIYQSLSNSEQKEINPQMSLMDLTEQYVRIRSGSRDALNLLLQKVFMKAPVSLKWHQTLAKIPHIKTIITTNYDRLFELAYQSEILPIINETDLVNRDNRTELFKVHGDVNDLNSILITRTDYTSFFSNNVGDNLIWASIKERIAHKAIVFIGYDFEDENVKMILNKVNEVLGSYQKEVFLIAPDFKKHKSFYLTQFNIQYLNMKGEVFVEKLYQDIKENITSDFSKGYPNPETLRKFFFKNDLEVDLKTLNDRYDLSSIRALKENIEHKINIKFKDQSLEDSFGEFVSGKKFGELVLDAGALQELKVLLNDINIIDGDISNYRLVLKSKPGKEGVVNVVFDNNSEFEDVHYQVFRSRQMGEIVASYKASDFIFQISKKKGDDKDPAVNFKFHLREDFRNVNDAIQTFKLCLNLVNGIRFTIYSQENEKNFSLQPVPILGYQEKFESNVDFFEALKKIERLYKVRFSNIGDYTKDDFNNVYKAIEFADGGVYVQQWDDEISFDLNKGTPLELLMKIEEGAIFTRESQEIEELNIYNQTIVLGYEVIEFFDLYIVNLSEVKNKMTTLVRLKSKSNEVKVKYVKSLHKDGAEL